MEFRLKIINYLPYSGLSIKQMAYLDTEYVFMLN